MEEAFPMHLLTYNSTFSLYLLTYSSRIYWTPDAVNDFKDHRELDPPF